MLLYSVTKFLDSTYRGDKVVLTTFFVSLALNIAMWVLLYLKLSPFSFLTESGQIPLHYNIYFGIDSIGMWYKVFVIPLLGLFIILFNNVLAYTLYIKERLVSYTLVITQAVIHLVLLAAAIFIVLLNL